jgi:glutaconate CoA-transferase, subunit B
MDYRQGGRIEVAFLGAAQMGRYSNIDTTVTGNHEHPKTRLPGSGWACEIASNGQQVYMMARLNRRTFVERVDSVTNPGHLSGRSGERSTLGMPRLEPQLVVTDNVIFRFDTESGEIIFSSLHPGIDLGAVQGRPADPCGSRPIWRQRQCPPRRSCI